MYKIINLETDYEAHWDKLIDVQNWFRHRVPMGISGCHYRVEGPDFKVILHFK